MFPPRFIVAGRIGNSPEITSKKRLLEILGGLLASDDPGLNAEGVFECLLGRERLGSTGLGHGVALPHARMKEVTEAVGAFVRLREGVGFDAIDDKPVDLAFALLVPESATEVHLQLLAQLASMFSDPRLREDLRRAPSVERIQALLEGGGGDSRDP